MEMVPIIHNSCMSTYLHQCAQALVATRDNLTFAQLSKAKDTIQPVFEASDGNQWLYTVSTDDWNKGKTVEGNCLLIRADSALAADDLVHEILHEIIRGIASFENSGITVEQGLNHAG